MKTKIYSLDDFGSGIGKIDNKIVFVPKTLPDELIDVIITKEKKKFAEGNLISIIEQSKDRVESSCPYFALCSGCHLRHMHYDNTIIYKKNKLEHIFQKYVHEDHHIEIIGSKDQYRNKITLKIINHDVGYYLENTHKLLKIDTCLNVMPSINNFIKDIKLLNIINGEITIRANYNNELIIYIKSDDNINVNTLTNHKIVGIIQNNNVLLGDKSFIELIGNMLFKVSYNSFFQVNRDINAELFKLLNNVVNNQLNVLDLYCGVGSLGLSIAKKVNKLIGIDNNENNILDALVNAKMNKIDNAYFMLGDAAKVISKIEDKIDLIIVDPPRAGIDKEGINNILTINPAIIIYISCDPMTLTRDLNILKEKYTIKEVIGLDMFPYTYHVETFVKLERNNYE